MKPRLFTATEIAEEICRADRLALSDHTISHSQVRNVIRRGMLENGVVVDKRGTYAFPAVEIYRARILNALADLTMSVDALRDPLTVAFSNTMPLTMPERCRIDGGYVWHGFRSVIEGVAAGERWTLEIRSYRPGYLAGKRIVASFVLAGDRVEGVADEVLGTGAPQATVMLDLNNLFAGLPVWALNA